MTNITLYIVSGIIMIPVVLFSLICQFRVDSKFKKYSKVANSRNLTGAEAAYMVLKNNGITDVKIKRIPGNLTDNYDPKSKTINLSEDVFGSVSISAIGVACHEAGHACQWAQSYVPVRIRRVIIPLSKFGSTLGIPLVIIGCIFTYEKFIIAGIVLYSLVVILQLITLPVEFNASKRAIQTINEYNFLTKKECKKAKKVLRAAAMTYVASLASALASLLRLLVLRR